MVHAIQFHEAGGPEVMKWEEVEVGDPGPGEIRVKQTAAGLNFIDIYIRSGARPVPMPNGLASKAVASSSLSATVSPISQWVTGSGTPICRSGPMPKNG